MKVLIVEESAADQTYLRNLLQGHDCAVAGNCQKAIEQVVQDAYDLIVLDMMIEQGLGASLLDLLEKNHITVPVITISSDRGLIAQRRCERFGVYAFVRKPIDDRQAFQNIIDRLAESLEKDLCRPEALPRIPATQAVQTSLGASPMTPVKPRMTEPTAPPLWMQMTEARHASNN